MSRGSCRSAADMAVAHCLALCEFLILYHNVCCINLISFPVCITSGLDTACHNNADSPVLSMGKCRENLAIP